MAIIEENELMAKKVIGVKYFYLTSKLAYIFFQEMLLKLQLRMPTSLMKRTLTRIFLVAYIYIKQKWERQ